MSAIFAMGCAAGLIVAFFTIAQRRALRNGQRMTVCDPVSWVIAGCCVGVAGYAGTAAAAIVLAACAVGAASDRQTGYLFDAVAAGAGGLLCIGAVVGGELPTLALGAGSCGGVLWVLHLTTRGRGVGLGDVKLAALIGGGLGVRIGAIAVGAAFVAGAIVAVGGLVSGRVSRGDSVDFGPYLAIGSMLGVALAGGI